jgi:CHASE3 domain sensor protein
MNEMQEIRDRLAKIEERTEMIFRSAEKTRKYFMWTLIVTVVTIVLPAIGLLVAIPMFLKTMDTSALGI